MDIEFSQIHEMVYMHDIVNSDSKKETKDSVKKNSLMLRRFSRKQHHGH